MAITVQCGCGKRTGVSDALAGRVVRCPACGEELVVAGPAPGAGKAGVKTKRAGRAVDVSQGQKVALWAIGVLLVIGGVFYFGPVRVWHQWGAMEPKASGAVQDLVIESLKEHMKQEIPDPRAHRRQPTVEGHDVSFFQPIVALTMPEKVAFIGKSNQGSFSGNYNTRTGEVDATVWYGGYSVAGMVDVVKPTGTFHLVGRVVDGKRQFEIDGKKID